MTDLIGNLSGKIDQCMLADRPRLERRLRSLQGEGTPGRGKRGRRRRSGGGPPDSAGAVAEAIEASWERARRRAAALPKPSFPDDLPVAGKKDEIAAAIRDHQVVIICGETGSGKTTQLPKICLELGRGVTGMIGHTQPRRIAARSVAMRIAEELGQPLGESVGYKVRFGDHTGPDAHVKIMTDGMLLAETRSDRALLQYDTIIVDEAHERSLNIDFLLGYLHRLLPRRPELRLVITSATIDPKRFSDHFGGAPIVEVSGRTYPVEMLYRPVDDDDGGDLGAAILDAVDELAEYGPGDILVFLAGEREIREVAEMLRKHHPPQTGILPLFARLSAAEQHRVFEAHGGRRIVLATNIAETSLTVPGIRYVVDPGRARISRYSPRRHVQMLPIEDVSQASANQRAGRCGRVADGVCIRLFDEEDFTAREAFTQPEILRTNLASVVLQMHALDLGRIEAFPFLERPRKAAVRDGYRTLHEIGALDERHRITDLGRRIAHLPVDPRIARMLIAAETENALSEVLIIAAALSVQDPRERPHDKRDAADEAHARFNHEDSDFLWYVNVWTFYHEQKKHLSWNKLRKCCGEQFISFMRMREWVDVHGQLKRQLTESGVKLNPEPAEPDAVHQAILTGLLGHVARRDDRGHGYTAAGGKQVFLFPGSSLFSAGPKWIVAAELVETTRLYARTVARIDPAWLESLGAHLVRRKYSHPRWDFERREVVADERVSLFGLPIVDQRVVPYGPIDRVRSREIFIDDALVGGGLPDDDIAFLAHNRALVQQIDDLQARRRRRDLLLGTAGQQAFYDARLPEDVFGARSLHAWRRKAELHEPQVLHMTEADLLMAVPETEDPHRFPDTLVMPDASLPLEYRHEPGAADDGVTVVIPPEAIALLDQRRLDWLVPGMLQDRVVALLRTLPKSLRRRFVPAPDFARACVDRLRFGVGDLVVELSTLLGELTGIEVPLESWSPDDVPAHLRMGIRVVDVEGEVLGFGRSVEAVRAMVGAKAEEAFAEARLDDALEVRGLVTWDFDDLPATVELRRGGVTLPAYPALVDRGDTVDRTVLTTAEQAAVATRGGVRRLLRLQLAEEIEYHLQALPEMESMRMHWATLGHPEALDDQLALLAVDRARLGSEPTPRTRDAFEAALNRGFGVLWDHALEAGRIVGETLVARQELLVAMDRVIPPQWADAVADIHAHLGGLLAPGFLFSTPGPWLPQLPRYLRADAARFRKLAGGGHGRDQRQQAELAPLIERWQTRRGDAPPSAALEQYRWMLEEQRVAVFAQELGTAIPVSKKRLDKQWEAV